MVDAERFYDDFANPWVMPQQGYSQTQRGQISYNAALDISSRPASFKKTIIWGSISLENCAANVVESLITTGLDVAILETSNNVEQLTEIVHVIRQAEETLYFFGGIPKWIGIAIATNGPTILTGGIDGGEAYVKQGDNFKLTTDKAYYDKGDAGVVFIDYDNIHNIVNSENRIFIMDGTIPLLVTNFHGSNIICTVECDGVLRSWRSVFLPNIEFAMPPLSDLDNERIKCGIELGMNIVLAGNVRKASDILAIRELVGEKLPNLKIYARIECYHALQRFDEIMDVADGILVNRTCIGVEVPFEKVFIAQKNLISRCVAKGVPVIVGREFISSMEKNSRPRHNESNDIANAIIDGADGIAVPTTACSNYPVECLEAVVHSCLEGESAVDEFKRFRHLASALPGTNLMDTLAVSAVEAAFLLHASVIISFDNSNAMVNKLAMYKPNVPIIAIAATPRVARNLVHVRCVVPLVYTSINDGYTVEDNWPKFIKSRLDYAIAFGKICGYIRSGDPIVLVYADQPVPTFENFMRVVYVSDIVEPISY